MNATPIPADDFRINFTDYLGRVMYGREVIAITRYNRSAAYLVSPEVIQLLLDPSKRLTKRQRQTAFKKIDELRAQMPAVDEAELETDIQQAVDEVRAERRKRAKP